MARQHNKRRNVGLLYEFLVRTISCALVEGNKKKSSSALKILRRYFKPGSELYKEFRLMNALIKTTVSSDTVAASIMNEAKIAAKSHNMSTLDREKSLLIKQINYTLNDDNDDFYDQHINEYRMYATVQTLLNDWRAPNKDLQRLASYEDQLVQWLTSQKISQEEKPLSEESTGTSRLLMKVMTKKLNEKYAGVLNEDQRSLVKAYVFSTANEDPTIIQKKLNEIKNDLLEKISLYESTHLDDQYVIEKLNQARNQIISESLEQVDDDSVTRFMLYTKLSTELESE